MTIRSFLQKKFLEVLEIIIVAPAEPLAEGIAGDSENPPLESCEFMFESGLIHRTIIRFINNSFHAPKILLETAEVWQGGDA